MKYILATSLFMGLISLGLSAQPQPSNPADPLGFARGIFGGVESGDYNFFHYSGSEIEAQKLAETFQRADADKEYFLNSVKALDAAMTDLVNIATGFRVDGQGQRVINQNSLRRMSQNWSASGTFTPADQFIDAVNEYEVARVNFENKLVALTAMSNGAFPSAIEFAPLEPGQKREITAMPNYGNINFKSISDFYRERVQQITAELANLPHGIIYKNNLRVQIEKGSGKGLVLEHPDFNLTPAEIRRIQDEIKDAYMFSDPDEYDAIERYTTTFRRNVQKVWSEYGKGNRFRMALQRPDEAEALIEEIKRLQEWKWVRSALRVKYGFPLGFPKFTWKERWFNLDEIIGTEPTWEETVLQTDEELVEQARDLRNALRVADQKSRRLTQDGRVAASERDALARGLAAEDDLYSSILDGDTTLIGRVGSVVNFIGGNRPSAEVLRYLIAYVLAADLAEERIVRQGGGQRILADRYLDVYFGTEESAEFYGALAKRYQSVLNPNIIDDDDPFGGPRIGADDRTLVGQTFSVAQVLDAKLIIIDNVIRPNQRLLANAARMTGDNPASRRRQTIDDIIGGGGRKKP